MNDSLDPVSVVPFAFFVMIMGVYYIDFTKIKFLRILAYYSYNWYLWHPIYVIIVKKYCGATFMGLIVFILISFLTAFVFTILIEEPALKARKVILNKIFQPKQAQTTIVAEN